MNKKRGYQPNRLFRADHIILLNEINGDSTEIKLRVRKRNTIGYQAIERVQAYVHKDVHTYIHAYI